MNSYITYNDTLKRTEIYNQGVLIITFENTDPLTEVGDSYFVYNPFSNKLEIYNDGVLVRTYG